MLQTDEIALRFSRGRVLIVFLSPEIRKVMEGDGDGAILLVAGRIEDQGFCLMRKEPHAFCLGPMAEEAAGWLKSAENVDLMALGLEGAGPVRPAEIDWKDF